MRSSWRVLALLVGVVLVVPMAPASAEPVPQVGASQFVPDPAAFFNWVSADSQTDCGASPWCEIESTQFYVPRSEPEWLYGIARTTFAADGRLPILRDSGVGMFLDVDRDGEDDYRSLAPAENFGPNDIKSTTVERRTKQGWANTGVVSTWGIGTYGWVVNLEWRRLRIAGAAMRMVLCDAGLCDASPENFTPYIKIKDLVDGTVPGKVSSVTVAYALPKGRPGTATVTWLYNPPAGSAPLRDYAYRYSLNKGKKWSKWIAVSAPSALISGLKKGMSGFVEIKARNSIGFGPTVRTALRT